MCMNCYLKLLPIKIIISHTECQWAVEKKLDTFGNTEKYVLILSNTSIYSWQCCNK